MYNAESSAGVMNEFIKCHPRDGKTTDRIYNYAYEMTRLFHGIVLHVRKKERKTHTECVFQSSSARGCKKNIGNKGKYAVLSSASGVESYCRYIIRLSYIIMQIFIASHISRYMGENEGKETVHGKFSYNYLAAIVFACH